MARGARLPDVGTAEPRRAVWEAGRILYRVHSRKREAADFNPTPQDHHFGGGRFDSTPNDMYSYLYAAPHPTTALAERLLRDIGFDGTTPTRVLPRRELEGKRLSQVRLARDVTLLSLRTLIDLNAVQQDDDWLVRSKPTEYAFTRRWAHWLRAEAPWAQGFLYGSRLAFPKVSLVLFDQCAHSDLLEATDEPPRDLDEPDSVRWVDRQLKQFRVRVGPPDTADTAGTGA
ncbi:RES family NAD+ phosphorylase [Streptomyces sp. NPDC048278]|uniref:RES family NAD+ phosphorylase n=1 Tax=Streptomyces sp. NPDC048278 TaxID=3155809 RepID=UPI00341BA3E5